MFGRVAHKPVEEVRLQLRLLGASRNQLMHPEVLELSRIILDNETIEAFITGWYEAGVAMLVATTQRIIFIDKTLFGVKVDEISYESVNAIHYDMNMFFGKMKLYTRSKDIDFKWIRKNNLRNFCDYAELRSLRLEQSEVTKK